MSRSGEPHSPEQRTNARTAVCFAAGGVAPPAAAPTPQPLAQQDQEEGQGAPPALGAQQGQGAPPALGVQQGQGALPALAGQQQSLKQAAITIFEANLRRAGISPGLHPALMQMVRQHIGPPIITLPTRLVRARSTAAGLGETPQIRGAIGNWWSRSAGQVAQLLPPVLAAMSAPRRGLLRLRPYMGEKREGKGRCLW